MHLERYTLPVLPLPPITPPVQVHFRRRTVAVALMCLSPQSIRPNRTHSFTRRSWEEAGTMTRENLLVALRLTLRGMQLLREVRTRRIFQSFGRLSPAWQVA